MNEINNISYPQMIEKINCKIGDNSKNPYFKQSVDGPAFFVTADEVLFERAADVSEISIYENEIQLTIHTNCYVCRYINTHETIMQQFQDEKLKGQDIKVTISFFNQNVVRVTYGTPKVYEHAEPMFIGKPDNGLQVQIDEDAEMITAYSDNYIIKIKKKPFHISLWDKTGKLVWQEKKNELFTADIFDLSYARKDGRQGMFNAFHMTNQEEIFGLGERFDYVNRKGKSIDFWNKDVIGSSNARSYINVPFYMSTLNYGVFIHSTAAMHFEIGTKAANTISFGVEDDYLDYFVIGSDSLKGVLKEYCGLTGFSPLPPVWSFGLWMSRNSYLSWDVVNEVVDEFEKYKIPFDVIHLDTAWFAEDWNCDLKFSKERFANPKQEMQRLREKGKRVSLWQYNFIPPKDNNEHYKEAMAKSYLAKNADGAIYQFKEGTRGSWIDDVIIDFFNPDTQEWYQAKIKELIKLGAATIKTDFGEGIPYDAHFYQITGDKCHNWYALVYNAVVSKAIKEVTGEYIVWARSGTAGSQRYPIHWGGDSQCSFDGLSGTLRAALSIGLSGFPFFSHDIGGFIGRPSPELYIRWTQLGLFCSHSRCHGCGNENSREPWSFSEEALEIFRDFAKLRYRLMPYIYKEAQKCTESGLPMVRHLLLEYPEDRTVYTIDDEYFFGDSMLIAPILQSMEDSKTRCLYLPKGVFYDYNTKEKISSNGEWITVDVSLDKMPIYIKDGSVICYTSERMSTNNEIGKVVLAECYGDCAYDGNCEVIYYR